MKMGFISYIGRGNTAGKERDKIRREKCVKCEKKEVRKWESGKVGRWESQKES